MQIYWETGYKNRRTTVNGFKKISFGLKKRDLINQSLRFAVVIGFHRLETCMCRCQDTETGSEELLKLVSPDYLERAEFREFRFDLG